MGNYELIRLEKDNGGSFVKGSYVKALSWLKEMILYLS